MRFRVLGPVEVEADGRILPVSRRRERCLLAILLLEQDRMVPIERLCELLWEGHPPDSARRSVQSHVARLRGMLNTDSTRTEVRLTGTPTGYRLQAEPELIDAHVFRSLVARARPTGDPANRCDLLERALKLWRGPALHNAGGDWLRARICADLDGMRLTATEDWLSARLELGQHGDLVPEIARAISAYPTNERLAELLMRTLYQNGRRTDALAAYTRIRIQLAEEWGIDPSARLRELDQAIRREEPATPEEPVARRTATAGRGHGRAGSASTDGASR